MKNTLFTCSICKDIFRNHSDLKNHVRRDHQSSVKVKFQNGDVVEIKRAEDNTFKATDKGTGKGEWQIKGRDREEYVSQNIQRQVSGIAQLSPHGKISQNILRSPLRNIRHLPSVAAREDSPPTHPLHPPTDSGLWFEWEMGFRELYLCKRRLKGNGGGLEMLHILPHTKSLPHKPKIHFSSIVRRNS